MKTEKIKKYLEENYNIKFFVTTYEFNKYEIVFNINENKIKFEYTFRNERDEEFNFNLIRMFVDYYIVKCFRKEK